MLIVGGGPAGAAAAIYAARKGIRTGVVAERFGGQVLDTMAHRELHLGAGHRGPEAGRGAGAARQASYDVDVMDLQRATRLVPADEPGGLHRPSSSRAARSLQARTVVLATGARWRADERAGRGRVPQQGRRPTARTATARCSRASASR